MKRLLEYTIELVEDLCHSQYEEEKVSSSSLRKRLLGTVYNPLKVGPHYIFLHPNIVYSNTT